MASGPPCSHPHACPVPIPTSPSFPCPRVPHPVPISPSLSPCPPPCPYVTLPVPMSLFPPLCPLSPHLPPHIPILMSPSLSFCPPPCPHTLKGTEPLSCPAQAGTEGGHGPGGCCHLGLACCHHPGQPGGHGDTQGWGGTWGQGGTRNRSSRDRIAVTCGDTGDPSVSPSQSPPSIHQRPLSSFPVPSQSPQCLPVMLWPLSQSPPSPSQCDPSPSQSPPSLSPVPLSAQLPPSPS